MIARFYFLKQYYFHFLTLFRQHRIYKEKYRPQYIRKNKEVTPNSHSGSVKKRRKSISNAKFRKNRFIKCSFRNKDFYSRPTCLQINSYYDVMIIKFYFRIVDTQFQKIKSSENWKQSLSSCLSREEIIDLLDFKADIPGPGAFLKEEKERVITKFAKVPKETLVKCTENLTFNNVKDLRKECPPLKVIFPGITTLIKYRDECSAPIFALSPHETLDGCYLSTLNWVTKMIEDFINNHEVF